ncbi:MAG TPA: ATP-binding protein [Spirillospora sp.]|nr:ATP-binding protein [Spirillospora sp.]
MLKARSLYAAAGRLAERARTESWTHEEFLAACLQHKVAAREARGSEARIRTARFPARKSLEDFDFDHQHSAGREDHQQTALALPHAVPTSCTCPPQQTLELGVHPRRSSPKP